MPEITAFLNGLRVATDTMQETETVAVSVWTASGSRYESEEEQGIAHFLEHMAFKGTKRRNALQIAEAFDAVGGYFNAQTSREHTVYYAKVLKEDAELAIDVLADILQHSLFDPEELERERGVVLQELAMSEDTPDDIVFDYFQNTAYPGQPMGRPILGTEASIREFRREGLQSYIRRHYHAPNVVVGVAGNIRHKQASSLVEKHFNALPKGKKVSAPKAKYSGGERFVERDLEQVQWVLGFKAPSYHEQPDVYSVQLLGNILGGSMSSRLFQEIREKRGLAYSVSAGASNYADTGLFTVYAGTAPEHLKTLEQVVCDELRRATGDITKDELDRARAQVRASLLMGREGAGYRADDLGRLYTCFDRYVTPEEMVEKIQSVTVSQVKTLLEQLLTAAPLTITALGKVQGAKGQAALTEDLRKG